MREPVATLCFAELAWERAELRVNGRGATGALLMGAANQTK